MCRMQLARALATNTLVLPSSYLGVRELFEKRRLVLCDELAPVVPAH